MNTMVVGNACVRFCIAEKEAAFRATFSLQRQKYDHSTIDDLTF